MSLTVEGFHTMMIVTMLMYRFACDLVELIIAGHPLVYIPENSEDVFCRTGLRYGRLVGCMVYYDIKFKRGHLGVTFELSIPTKRMKYMDWLKDDSDEVVVGSQVFHEDDYGTNIPDRLFCCRLRAIINAKILGGVKDYLTPAMLDCVPAVIDNFNGIVRSIHPALKPFEYWKLVRLDYCLNVNLGDYGLNVGEGVWGKDVPVYAVDVIALIRASKLPRHYRYAKQSAGNSAYLVNDSVHINIYCKSQELTDRGVDIGAISDDILRIEVQCLNAKMYQMKHGVDDVLNVLLNGDVCRKVVVSYWKRFVGMSDWYSMSEAKKLIRDCGFRLDKQKRLIWALDRIAHLGGVDNAGCRLSKNRLVAFNQSLRELEGMGINPVTIPKERKIKHIRNPVRVVLESGGTPAINIGEIEEDEVIAG